MAATSFNMGLNLSRRSGTGVRRAVDGVRGPSDLRRWRRDSADATRRGFQTSNGFRTRTPWTKPVNMQASYNLKVGGRNLVLSADAFNLFNTQTVLDYNSFSDLQFGVPNPDFGAAGVSGVISGQQLATPRQFRVGVTFRILRIPARLITNVPRPRGMFVVGFSATP